MTNIDGRFGAASAGPPPPQPVPICEQVAGEHTPRVEALELRSIAGIGRKRARQLAAAWPVGESGGAAGAGALDLEQLPGIGPVLAGRIRAWAATGGQPAYTGPRSTPTDLPNPEPP
ncbi:MAG: hypothetical protein R3F17_05765 [Planctomycetota bacterium]